MFKKSSPKTVKYEGSGYIHKYVHKDILIKVICDVIQGKATKLTYDDTGCSDLVDEWNEMINALCDSRKKIILETNDIDIIGKQIEEIKEKVDRINEIVNIVKGITNQTNLLTLNTAIEAVRAGEQGRGFIVMADEARRLSEYTKNSVLDMQKNIFELQQKIDSSVQRINATSYHMKETI